jgi:hypothetical protein
VALREEESIEVQVAKYASDMLIKYMQGVSLCRYDSLSMRVGISMEDDWHKVCRYVIWRSGG